MSFQPADILLGKYRVESLAGEGTFGEVYQVIHPTLNPRAIKILRRDMPGIGSTDLANTRKRFRIEAQLGDRLTHPNVVKVLEFEDKGDELYLIMEYAPGKSLKDKLKDQGTLTIEESVRLGVEICAGLQAIHEKLHIVHRDIKPSNILFETDGTARISDLGIAQTKDEERTRLGSLAPPHPGDPLYMSPEQGTSRDYLQPSSDIYSLGCVLFECLTGIPYKENYGDHVRDYRKEVPLWLDAIIARAVAETPGKLSEQDQDKTIRYRKASLMNIDLNQGWLKEVEQREELRKAEQNARQKEINELEERSRQIAKLFNAGNKSILRGNFDEADRNVTALNQMGENGQLAATRLQHQINRTRQELEKKRIDRLIAVIKEFIKSKDWERANNSLTELSKIGARGELAATQAATQLIQQIDKARASRAERIKRVNEAIKTTISQAQPNLWGDIEGNAQLVFGPENGSLQVNKDGKIKLARSGTDRLRDSIIYAEFQNTYTLTPVPWACGFMFRNVGAYYQYRLVVRSSGEWTLENHTGEMSNPKGIQGGRIINLDTNSDGTNRIMLVCNGTSGALYLNGKFVAELLLDARMDSGEVMLISGAFQGYDEGYSTNYSDFAVWKLPPPPPLKKLVWWNPVDHFRLLSWSLLKPAKIMELEKKDAKGLSAIRRLFAATLLWLPFSLIAVGLLHQTVSPYAWLMELLYSSSGIKIIIGGILSGFVITLYADFVYNARSNSRFIDIFTFLHPALLQNTAIVLAAALRINTLSTISVGLLLGLSVTIVVGIAPSSTASSVPLILGSIIGILVRNTESAVFAYVFPFIIAYMLFLYNFVALDKSTSRTDKVYIMTLAALWIGLTSFFAYLPSQHLLNIGFWPNLGSSVYFLAVVAMLGLILIPTGNLIRSRIREAKKSPWALFVCVLGYSVFAIQVLGGAPQLRIPGESSPLSRPSRTPTPAFSLTLTPSRTPTQPTKTIISTPTLDIAFDIGSTMTGKDGMTLLYVPVGEFTMGSDNGQSDERPVHTVYLDAFWIDQTEVTNKMYSLCVNTGLCKEPTSKKSRTHSSYYGNADFDNYPVIYVTWNMAKTYCEWVDRRLPTEAEWEKSARGDDERDYPWGSEYPIPGTFLEMNFFGLESNARDTTEVGKYPNGASPYGALDMAGNVLNWVNDWYSDTYYASSPTSNPLGPDLGQYHVLRGGSWNYTFNSSFRSAYRGVRLIPSSAESFVGFRCAMSATP